MAVKSGGTFYKSRSFIRGWLVLFSLLLGIPCWANTRDRCKEIYEEISGSTFRSDRAQINRNLRKLSNADEVHLRELIEGLFFVDFKHSAPHLLEAFLKRKRLSELDTAHLYDEPLGVSSLQEPAFANFLKARKYLRSHMITNLTSHRIQETHRRAMSGGVQSLAESDLGKYRKRRVVAVPEWYSAKDFKDRVAENPYLRYREWFRLPFGRALGQLLYPTPADIRPEALALIRSTHGDLVAEIEEFQLKRNKEWDDASWLQKIKLWQEIQRGYFGLKLKPDPELESLTGRLIKALVDSRTAQFNADMKKIGDVDSLEKFREFVDALSSFQRDFVSIHPFRNGNGRTSRHLLYAMMEQKNIAPPRFLNPDNDLNGPIEEWREEMLTGILATHRLHQDIAERIRWGMSLENSPELLSPSTPRKFEVTRLVGKSKKVHERERLTDVESRQFAAYLRTRMKDDLGLAGKFRFEPIVTVHRLRDDFDEFTRKHRVDYQAPVKGIGPVLVREIGLNFVDPDYFDAYGVVWAKDPERWRKKMDLWHTSETVWKGIPYTDQAPKDVEILRMFDEVHPRLIASSLEGRLWGYQDSTSLRDRVLTEFSRYNSELLGDKLVQRIVDNTSPASSPRMYAFKASKSQTVGESAAKNAGSQIEVKGRLNVGIRQAKHDVELGRLNLLSGGKFKDRQALQQTVLGIGGADPDAVMVVHKLDDKGNVVESFVRNPEKPSQIWVVEGEYRPEMGPPPKNRLFRTVKIQ